MIEKEEWSVLTHNSNLFRRTRNDGYEVQRRHENDDGDNRCVIVVFTL